MATRGSVLDALEAVAGRGAGARVFHGDDGGEVRIEPARLLEDAERDAAALTEAGVLAGDAIGVLGPNEHAWVRWAFAIWRANATLVPLQYPLRPADHSALAEQVGTMSAATRCRVVVGHPSLLDVVPEGLAFSWSTSGGGRSSSSDATSDPTTPAVAQFTSGTTGGPRAALVGLGAVVEAIRATGIAYDFSPDDVVTGWQPF